MAHEVFRYSYYYSTHCGTVDLFQTYFEVNPIRNGNNSEFIKILIETDDKFEPLTKLP